MCLDDGLEQMSNEDTDCLKGEEIQMCLSLPDLIGQTQGLLDTGQATT